MLRESVRPRLKKERWQEKNGNIVDNNDRHHYDQQHKLAKREEKKFKVYAEADKSIDFFQIWTTAHNNEKKNTIDWLHQVLHQSTRVD